MDYTRHIELDVSIPGDIPVVRVKQGDQFARFLEITLLREGEQFEPEEGAAAMFRCEKPDGTAVVTDSMSADSELGRYLVVINNDGTVTVELTDQVAAVAGRCKCDISLMKSGKVLSTADFVIEVLASPNVASQIVSDNDFRTLTNAIEQVEDLLEEALPTVCSLTLSTNWVGNESPFTQAVTVSGYNVTAKTKVDLYATAAVIETMRECRTDEIMVINNNGTLTAYAIGKKPTSALTVQASLSETNTSN